MTEQEESLPGFGPPPRKAHRNHDFLDLFPGKVFPTGGIHILENGNHLLHIKSYEYGKEITRAQRKIWNLLVAHGEVIDAPGSISVVCVWGLGGAARNVTWFDHMGESKPITISLEQFRVSLRDWFDNHA